MVSVTETVDPAIELIEHRFRGERGPDELAYLRSHAFFNQLAPADACVRSFVEHELDPDVSWSAGGEAGTSLGMLLGPPGDVADPLRRAVATTLTSSYLTAMSAEDPPGSEWVPGRDAEALWEFWVGHLRPSAVLALDIPDDFLSSVRRDGGRLLEAEIRRLGLAPGFFRRRTVSQRCADISGFGVLLRVGQTAAFHG